MLTSILNQILFQKFYYGEILILKWPIFPLQRKILICTKFQKDSLSFAFRQLVRIDSGDDIAKGRSKSCNDLEDDTTVMRVIHEINPDVIVVINRYNLYLNGGA